MLRMLGFPRSGRLSVVSGLVELLRLVAVETKDARLDAVSRVTRGVFDFAEDLFLDHAMIRMLRKLRREVAEAKDEVGRKRAQKRLNALIVVLGRDEAT